MANKEFPRQFVEARDTLSEWSRIAPYFEDLKSRALDTPQQMNGWLVDWSELAACIDEVGQRRYVNMTCHTDDPECKKAYLDFVENIDPKCKPMWHVLNKRYMASPAAQSLPRRRFEVFDRCIRNAVELYNDENVSLQVEEARLEQNYQETMAAMTVTYEGREQTLQQLSKYLERTERGVRQEVWELSINRRLQDAQRLELLFDKLFKLRHQMALNAGFDEYRAYVFRLKERFDYTPEDCLRFHDAIERTCVPLLRAQHASRKGRLRVEALRPWDLSVDTRGRPPLKPFAESEELVRNCTAIFDHIDPGLGDQFRDMAARGDLDLDSRKGKTPGGYQSTFQEARRPFIFMNAVGLERDVRTLLHECGHAFHALACRDEPLVHYRSAPVEFSEVASMAMELMAFDHLDVFYCSEDLERAQRNQLQSIVSILPWVATVDAFQHWMYTHPQHTPEQRRDQWLSLHQRFGGLEDFSGYERALECSWHRQLHLFEAPFYYVEYGIAQLGALQLWQNARRSRGQALGDYHRALALGGSRKLPELFEAANIRFDFSIETIGPLMDTVQDALSKLGE
ncbi:MAG: M3 family oligoendopeptidase [Phycisphaerae bacterium]